jgi:short-subunit dehydrogenase
MKINQRSFSGKTVVISGSSKGIGRVLARTLGSMGANIVINGSNADALNGTYAELKDLGYNVVAVKGNVTDIQDCYNIADVAVTKFGCIDIVIANAGVMMQGSFEKSSPLALKKVLDVNLLGTVFIIKACLPALKQTKGNILITGSASGFCGIPGAAAYSASKMALTAFADALKIELINTGVNISLAYVGFTENDKEKLVLGTDGQLIKKTNAIPAKLASQQSVAIKMINMIRYNQFKKTFSFIGKLNELITRFLPSLGTYILKRYYLKSNPT